MKFDIKNLLESGVIFGNIYIYQFFVYAADGNLVFIRIF